MDRRQFLGLSTLLFLGRAHASPFKAPSNTQRVSTPFTSLFHSFPATREDKIPISKDNRRLSYGVGPDETPCRIIADENFPIHTFGVKASTQSQALERLEKVAAHLVIAAGIDRNEMVVGKNVGETVEKAIAFGVNHVFVRQSKIGGVLRGDINVVGIADEVFDELLEFCFLRLNIDFPAKTTDIVIGVNNKEEGDFLMPTVLPISYYPREYKNKLEEDNEIRASWSDPYYFGELSLLILDNKKIIIGCF